MFQTSLMSCRHSSMQSRRRPPTPRECAPSLSPLVGTLTPVPVILILCCAAQQLHAVVIEGVSGIFSHSPIVPQASSFSFFSVASVCIHQEYQVFFGGSFSDGTTTESLPELGIVRGG